MAASKRAARSTIVAPTVSLKDQCANCKYWRRGWRFDGAWVGEDKPIGRCQFNPPVTLFIPADTSRVEGMIPPRVDSFFPVTNADDYCAGHERKADA